LKEALHAGVYIVKPSLREFSELMSAPLESECDLIKACRRLIENRRAEMVALTMGKQGAPGDLPSSLAGASRRTSPWHRECAGFVPGSRIGNLWRREWGSRHASEIAKGIVQVDEAGPWKHSFR
jgi:hypothetical protein